MIDAAKRYVYDKAVGVHFKDITQGETVKLRNTKHLVTIKPTLVIISY